MQGLVQACTEYLQGGRSLQYQGALTQHLTTLTAKTFISNSSNEHILTFFPLLTHVLMWLSQHIPLLWLITTSTSMTEGQPLEKGHLLARSPPWCHLQAQETCLARNTQGQMCMCFWSKEDHKYRW